MNAPDRPLADIARYVHSHEVAEDSIAAARLCLADALACALEALDQPDCTRLLGPLVPGTVVPNGSRVPGTSYVLEPDKAAFDLAATIRWLDYNDATSGALTTHPSDTVGAILTLADHLSRSRRPASTMRDVFDAMVRAYEIQGTLGLLNDFRKHGIDQPLLARVATAAVCTRLLGGSERQILNATSNAFIETTLSVVRNAPNIGTRKNWATAAAIADSVRMAYLAMKGEDGYPWVLSAPELGFHAARFGGEELQLPALGDDVIRRVMFKLVPAGMHGQTAAECAFRLHPQVDGRLDAIERITLRCHRTLMRIMDKRGELRNAADRDHCVQYIVAVGLIFGAIGPNDFSDAFAADPRIDALRAKMELAEDERYTRDFSDPAKRSSANSVEVQFRDGTSSGRIEVEYPAGHPRRRAEALPLLEAKLDAALARRYTPARCEQIAAVFADPEKLDRTAVHQFVDLLAP
ncbi:MAG TPA: 2-methylcitrate dehydratase [Burkholderiales bacterium]|nr:2-methylcitrate dehydratase [Burkholderiales bacterium]